MPTREERIAVLMHQSAERFADDSRRHRARSRWANFRRTGSALWIETADHEEADALWSAEFSGLILDTVSLSEIVRRGQHDGFIARIAAELPPNLAPACLTSPSIACGSSSAPARNRM